MTTVQKREGSRKLQPDQNSLQQQLLRNTASDRALLVVAADRAMTRLKKGKRTAENQTNTDPQSKLKASELKASELKSAKSQISTPQADGAVPATSSQKQSDARSDSCSETQSEAKLTPSVAAEAKSDVTSTVEADSGANAGLTLDSSEQSQSKIDSNPAAETALSKGTKVESPVQLEPGQAPDLVASARLLERATELAPDVGVTSDYVQTTSLSNSDANPVALSQLLTRAVDETTPQSKTAESESDSTANASAVMLNRQRTIDQQIHAQQLTADAEPTTRPSDESSIPHVDSVRINQPVETTSKRRLQDENVETTAETAAHAKAAAQADDLRTTLDKSTLILDTPIEPAKNDSEISTGSIDAGQIAAKHQPAGNAGIAAAAPYRALRRPRKRCGNLDHRYIHSSEVKSRRALAWDDLRFRYGLLPTVESAQVNETDTNPAVGNESAKKFGTAPVANVRRPNLTRRKAPTYVTELARLDADPALGSRHKNPFEIYQLELPLPERKSPLRQRKLIETSKSGRLTQAKLSTTTELNRKLRIKNKWWLLSQTVLQRTSFAMIFLALMIAGVVLFQQPVIEKKQSTQEITTFKAPQPTGTKKNSNQPESNSGNFQDKANHKATPPASVPDTKKFTPQVNVDTIASEEIIDLVGQIEVAENLSRVPRLRRNPASGLIVFDPAAQPVVVTSNPGPVDHAAGPNSLNGSAAMVAQVNPVIRSYLGPARSADKSRKAIAQRRAYSTAYSGLALDRHPEIFDFEIKLSQQSMEIFNTSILAGDRVSGGSEIAYLGVADALGKNTLSFSMSPSPDRRIDVRPFSSKFDLAPMQFFKFENRTNKPVRSNMVKLDKSEFDLRDRPTAMASHPVSFDIIVADSSSLTIP